MLGGEIVGHKFVPAIRQAQFINKTMGRIPQRLREGVTKKFNQAREKSGTARANYQLEAYAVKVSADRQDELNKKILMEQARAAAIACIAAGMRGDVWEVIATGAKIAKDNGIPTKNLIKYGEISIAARFESSEWWLGSLVRAEKRSIEAAAIRAGRVHKGGQIYATDTTVEERREAVQQAREFMARMELHSESGEVCNMLNAADAGLANPKIRHAELMTRINGFQEVAKKRGHVAIFCTATTPSRMHGHSTTGSKHDGTTPKQAQEYLAGVWSKVRAQLARDGVMVYGLRVVEPHHDGTPHWHMILFMRKGDKVKFRETFAAYFRAEDAHELTSYKAQKARVDFKTIDPEKGGAAAYVVKYIAKNIQGEGVGQDHESGSADCAETSERVLAWASVWGVRQFQQIGGHYVSAWREARRIKAIEREGLPPEAVAAWEAAQRVGDKFADWAAYLEALGGVETKARDALVRVAVEKEEIEGVYGLTVRRKVLGLWHRLGVLNSNRMVWRVVGR